MRTQPGAAWPGARFPALAGAVIAAAVALLLLPLPPLLLDGLLLANLAAAAAILWLALRAGHPRRLPQLPALLILGMLLRLGLMLGALRLLLRRGEAGRAAALGGDLLLGGDWATGAALLLGLFAVQYLVVARGGERVAEVAARFALDALPGQQAAIEADLRQGALSPEQAQVRRRELLEEAQVYGALDGALRFVRGDAAAGLLLLLCGLGGALWVGLGEGLGVEAALLRYGLPLGGVAALTQIAALLLGTAAGLLLSRGPAADAAPRVEPLLRIRAGQALALTPSTLAPTLARLEAELGFTLPRPALEPVPPGSPGKVLTVLLRGMPLYQGEPEDAPGAVVACLRAAAPELLGLDEVQQLLDDLARERPTLVRETVPRRVELPLLGQLLRRLLDERVVPLDLRAVLEALAQLDAPSPDPVLLTEQVRSLLGPSLLRTPLGGGAELRAVVVETEVEEALREARDGTPGRGETLALEPELEDEIVAAVAAAQARAPGAALLCHAEVRRLLARLLRAADSAPPVLAYGELPPRLPVTVVGRLGPGGFIPEEPGS